MLSHYGIYQFLNIIIANIIALLSINKVKKVFNEKGEFNEDGYNSLTDSEKETVKYMLSTGKPLHEFFKGMDIENGDDSANEIKKKCLEMIQMQQKKN